MLGPWPSRSRRGPGPVAAGGQVPCRVARRTLVESLYLLTAPVTAAAGLLLVLGGLCAGAVGLLVPGGSRLRAGGPALARWSADLERWRIAKVRSPAAGAERGPAAQQTVGRVRPGAVARRGARGGRCSPSSWSPRW